MDAITICAANYLPFANVLGKSFLEFNPDSTFSILVIDAEKTNFDKLADFKYLTPNDLEIGSQEFQNMAFYYNVTELATALKPSALKALFANGSEKIVYLDPDIQVFGEFIELEVALEKNAIVLTPHTLKPIPRDGLRPSEADIMGSGTFNLGFIALAKSEEANVFLNWWEERLQFDSISDPEEMLFTDQRWIDLVPSYFSYHLLREPGYNVAYWNLHEREISQKEENFFANQKPLKFFHFSGYRPEKPWILSKYVSDKPRIVISQNTLLTKLCKDYGEKAINQGWSSEFAITYGFKNFDSGKAIPSSLRRLYREDCIKAFRNGQILEPPTDWQIWATTRSVDSGNLSRILFSLWKSRPDLKRRYPDATGTEAAELQLWAKMHGVQEGVIDSDLIQIGSLIADSYPNEFRNTKGINVAGYLQGELGLGQSARLIHLSATQTKLPVTALNSNRSKSRQAETFESGTIQKIYPIVIAIVNADHFEFWINDIGEDRLKYSKIIGVWAWETEDFPKSAHTAFKYVDEIWAVSNFVKNAIQKHTKKPVFVFPTPIIAPKNIEPLDREAIGLKDKEEYNLFIFDYMSVFNRKNPIGLISAHMKAFPNSDGPTLVIKSTNGDSDPENREKLRFQVQARSDILLIENYLSRNQLTSLINECDSYISLHRSEGYGLTMAEAMALGKPVIATGYSGNLDFMDNENSILIPFTLSKVGPNSFPYDTESFWAEPNIDVAAIEISNLASKPELREVLGAKAKNYVETNFDLVRAAQFINTSVKRNYSWINVVLKQQKSNLHTFIPSKVKVLVVSLKYKIKKKLINLLSTR